MCALVHGHTSKCSRCTAHSQAAAAAAAAVATTQSPHPEHELLIASLLWDHCRAGRLVCRAAACCVCVLALFDDFEVSSARGSRVEVVEVQVEVVEVQVEVVQVFVEVVGVQLQVVEPKYK